MFGLDKLKLRGDNGEKRTNCLKVLTETICTKHITLQTETFHHLDMTLAVAEALNPNKPNRSQDVEDTAKYNV